MRIRILIQVMRICDHWSTSPPRLHFERPWPKAIYGSILSLYSSWIFTLMQIWIWIQILTVMRIQLLKVMRIGIRTRNPDFSYNNLHSRTVPFLLQLKIPSFDICSVPCSTRFFTPWHSLYDSFLKNISETIVKRVPVRIIYLKPPVSFFRGYLVPPTPPPPKKNWRALFWYIFWPVSAFSEGYSESSPDTALPPVSKLEKYAASENIFNR